MLHLALVFFVSLGGEAEQVPLLFRKVAERAFNLVDQTIFAGCLDHFVSLAVFEDDCLCHIYWAAEVGAICCAGKFL